MLFGGDIHGGMGAATQGLGLQVAATAIQTREQDLGKGGEQNGSHHAIIDPTEDGNEIGGDVDRADQVEQASDYEDPPILGMFQSFSIPGVEGFNKCGHGLGLNLLVLWCHGWSWAAWRNSRPLASQLPNQGDREGL